MTPYGPVLTVSGILFGFLFTGFWWSLNRELRFEAEQRHFKLGHILLILTMGVLGYSGIVRPLAALAEQTPELRVPYYGVVLALVGIIGYVLTEFGHYSVFRKSHYRTALEWIFFPLTIFTMVSLALYWAFVA